MDETSPDREPLTIVELEQDQCRLLYGEAPCAAALGTTGVRKCYNTRATCQDPENYDSSPSVVDTATLAKDATSPRGDISKAGAVEASHSVATEDASPQAVFFSSDGTKLYMIGSISGNVYQYPLATAWDLTSVGSVQASFSVSGEEVVPEGLFFKPDGTKLYIVGSASDQVRQYPLSTPWDLASAGAVEASFSVAGEDTSPSGVFLSSDGTKLYVVGSSSDDVHQYPLSTAWDVSSAGAVAASFSVSGEDNTPSDLSFRPDGKKLYVVGISSDQVHQYPLSTAWSIASAGAVEASFSVAGEETAPRGLFLKPDGSKLYVVGNNSDQVHQYPITGADGTIDGASQAPAHTSGFGQALNFDGVDDSLEILDAIDEFAFPGTAPFTVEFVLAPDAIPNAFARVCDKEFVDGGGAQGWRIRLRQSDTALVFERLRDGASDEVSAPIPLGESHFWSAVYDGADLILYRQGAERARAASTKSVLESGEALLVGNSSTGGTTDPYDGLIDELRIWGAARTPTEIRARMVLPVSGKESGLVGYWPLDTDPPGVATRTLRFTKPQTSSRRDLYLLPLLVDVSTAPTRLNPGGGSRDRGVLGDRSSVDLAFQDAPGSDRVVDKYRTERISGTAQTDEGGYQPLERGTFWAKWRARNPYYQNRRVRVLEGYVGQALEEMQRRAYFVDSFDGPDADGRVSIRAKDVLKLADDERAQAPRATPGELTATLTAGETTSFQATGAVIADYPEEPGLVRIGAEVIEYQTRVQATANEVEFQTLSRGGRGTEAAEHDAEDRVQRCLEFVNVPAWKIVEDLLVNFGNVPSEFVPITDWDNEGESWFESITFTAVITEPTPVVSLISEITQQAQFFIWWDEFAQEIKMRALRPPTEVPVVLDDFSHLIAGASSLTEDPEQRISQVWVFFRQKDPTRRLDDEGNYARVRIRVDLEAESPEQYGEPRIKKIFSRWIETEAQAIQVTFRTLQRFRDNPRTLKVRVDAKDRAALRAGEVADIETRTVLDERGLPLSTRWQVIATREEPAGEAVDLELLIFEFTGRFAFYMDAAAPVFADATEAEKKSLSAWYSEDNGAMPDGTEGYKYP